MGVGKSHFVGDFVEHLGKKARGSLAEPIVVRYDAWREAAISPEWWSIAAAMNRDVRHRRAMPARWVMSVSGMWHRVLRSPPVLIAVVLLVLAYVGMAVGLWENLEVVGTFITSVTTFVATGLLVGRALFWASPTIARLNVRYADNQLGLISSIVCGLRRWSPWQHRTSAQVVADTAVAVGAVVLIAAGIVAGNDWTALARSVREAPWTSPWIVGTAAGVVAVLLVAIEVPGWHGDTAHRDGLRIYLRKVYTADDAPDTAKAWLRSAAWAVLGAGSLLLAHFAGAPWELPAVLAGLALLGLAVHGAWIWFRVPDRRRRPRLENSGRTPRPRSSTIR